ncbi:MAG: biotin-dependent carboxyltransferase family protein [Nocardioides sp.]|nr:biotin-dependent carboxyltransferase family protein [Nocardioides sp.]
MSVHVTAHLLVLRAGPQCLVQDRGRPGLAHLGVPRAGALDRPAADLANRLVGNGPDAALLEVLLGGLHLRSTVGVWVALTGAPAPLRVGARSAAHATPTWVPAGETLRLGAPPTGLRSCLAVAGGIDVAPVLGSRSTDTLAGVGPAPVGAGRELPLGVPARPPAPGADTPRGPSRGRLRVDPGPRAGWCGQTAVADLCASSYVVRSESDRVGLRLDGPVLRREARGELPSEGTVLGAVQVPPDGQPVVFLADHPPTGGYPVVAVVRAEDLWQCAQLRPGEAIRFAPA